MSEVAAHRGDRTQKHRRGGAVSKVLRGLVQDYASVGRDSLAEIWTETAHRKGTDIMYLIIT